MNRDQIAEVIAFAVNATIRRARGVKLKATVTPEDVAGYAAAILALDGWSPIESAKEGVLVLLYMSLRSTGEPLGYEIGWLEDGDWMLSSKDNEPSDIVRPTHWRPLPPPPGDA